jgi:hypothetical protein
MRLPGHRGISLTSLQHDPAIEWVAPDLVDEVGEYTENTFTQDALLARGIEFETANEVAVFLSRGSLVLMSPEDLSGAENVTLGGEDFETED